MLQTKGASRDPTSRKRRSRSPAVSERGSRERPLARQGERPPASGAAGVAAAVLLIALVLAAYAPALQAGFVWDDDSYVTANPTLRSLDGLRRIWLQPGAVPQYYPLTFTSFWVEQHLWGLQPFGYHLVNIVLHALNTLLLWLVLRRLQVPAAWMAGAVFALHPMQVESVAWITERKNVLSGLFALSAILVYLRGVVPAGGAPDHRNWRRCYLATGVLFAGALLSKTVTCSLPAVLLLIAWWKEPSVDVRTVWRLSPLFAMGVALASVTIWMEQHHVGAAGEEWALSLVERGLVAGRVLWFYPRTLLWPRGLTFIYPRWSIDVRVWWQFLFPAAAVVVIVALWAVRERIGKAPLVAVLCYAGTLVPALGFFNVFPMRYSFVADHFAYLPIIGLIALGTAAAAAAAQRVAPASPFIGYAVCGTLLLGLAALTARQCGIYHDLHALWTDTLAKNPECWMAHNNLGAMLVKDGDLEAAIAHLTDAARLKPDNPEAHNDLGVALDMQGKADEAVAHYRQALALKPDYANAHYNLGDSLRTQGKIADAIAQYTQALHVNPDYPEAHNSLGMALAAQRQIAEAIVQYTEALRVNPDYPEAHHNLGNALRAQGNVADAILHYAAAVRLRPSYAEAHNNLGVALATQGKAAEGLAHLEHAVRLKPDYAEAQFNLGTVLIGEQRSAEATSHFIAGLRIRPEVAEAHDRLGLLFFEQGRSTEAIAEYRQALQLRPAYPDAHVHLGIALAAGGANAEALSHFEAAIELQPNHAAAHQQLEQLRQAQNGTR